MKSILSALFLAFALMGCGRNQGGDDQSTSIGRDSGSGKDVGGNGKVYDAGGARPGTNNPQQQMGTGRVDEGGGKTGSLPVGPGGPNASTKTNQSR